LSSRLDGVDLLALTVDGVEIAGHTVVVSLGITGDGTKVPLGLWLDSTENAALSTSMLQDLLARGLRIEGRVLCVIDGGKGIRKALADVLGDLVVIQRCQLHYAERRIMWMSGDRSQPEADLECRRSA
jgi:transposase-like protein